MQTYPSGVERTFRGGTEGVYRRESGEKESVLYEASITFDAEKMLTESDVHDISNALMKIL